MLTEQWRCQGEGAAAPFEKSCPLADRPDMFRPLLFNLTVLIFDNVHHNCAHPLKVV